MPTPVWKSHLALITANILFGMNFSFYLSIIRHFMPFETLFILRVFFAAACFVPWTLFFKRYRITAQDFYRIFIPTVLVIYGHEFMMLWAVKYTNPVDSSTIATMAPIVTLVVSAFMLHEKMHLMKWIGVGLGVAGTLVLIFGNGVPEAYSAEVGNALMLVSVVAAATNTIFIKPQLMRHGTMLVTGWYYLIGVVIAGPFFGPGLVEFDFGAMPAQGWWEVIYILVLGTTLPNYLLYYGTERLTSVHTGLYAYLQPVAATSLALLRGQVVLREDNYISAGLIFAAIILVMITYAKYKFPIPKI